MIVIKTHYFDCAREFMLSETATIIPGTYTLLSWHTKVLLSCNAFKGVNTQFSNRKQAFSRLVLVPDKDLVLF